MNTTGSYWIARVYLGKQYLSFTYRELCNLAYNMVHDSEPADVLHRRDA